MIKQIFPKTSADNVFVKSGIFKNKTLAQVIELLNNNSGGGGGGPSPEEPSEGITNFSQATSDTVLYEGDTYPKGTYKQVTLDQGILYNDLKFVLYSHPFDVYTISLNVVINRVDVTINNDISFGEIESFTSPTVWVPQFDNFKSSLPLSTKAITDGDKTYTFRKIQNSPLGEFGYWTDSQEYYSLPEMPVCVFKLDSNLYINIPETLIKTDIGDGIILTQSDLEDCYDGFLPAATMAILKYKGVDLGELDNLIVEIPTRTETISKKFTELNPVELHDYLAALDKGELGLLMSLLAAVTEPYADETMLLSAMEIIFLIQGSYVMPLIGFHSNWWISSGAMTGNSNTSTIPLVTTKRDASRYGSCLIYNKADNVASIGQPVVVLSLSGLAEGTLLQDYFPFSLNKDAVDCVVILHDVYALLRPQQNSDLYWEDTNLRVPLKSEGFESIFLQVATGDISPYITRTLYISDGELWNAVGSVDLSDVYSRIGSVESSVYSRIGSVASSVSDVNYSVQSLQNIVGNMKSIQYKQINIFNNQDPTYIIENLEYPTLYHVNYGVRPTDSYEQESYYHICYGGEVTIKVKTVSGYTIFQAPANGLFLVIPYYFSATNVGGTTNAVLGINFPIEKTEISKVLTNLESVGSYFVQKGGILNVLNTLPSPITVYLKNEYKYDWYCCGCNDYSTDKSNPITINPGESLKLVKTLYISTITSNGEYEYDSKYLNITVEYKKYDLNVPTKEFTVNGATFKMIKVDGGTFKMGSPAEEHPVSVDDFYIGEIEVTNLLKNAVLNISGGNADYAVKDLTWNDANSFIESLNNLAGVCFRLPTEAEWEFAARGGNFTLGNNYSGRAGLSNNTNYGWWQSGLPPIKKSMNELGLWDMSGGVEEWCYDNYKSYSRTPAENPTGPSTGQRKIVRGGGYTDLHEWAKVYYRYYEYPLNEEKYIGLRLAASYLSQSAFTVNNVTFTMIDVQGGEFIMGDGADGHEVLLDNFSIGQVEVTQALWEAVMGNNPSTDVGDNKPVTNVSWYDCQDFISLLNDLTGEEFRLPTEAEWEYAARGGNLSLGYLYSGSDYLDDVGWYYDNSNSSGVYLSEVAQLQPNELGLYDMSGNVSEWCLDWYGSYERGEIIQTLLTNPCVIDSNIQTHVTKGGSYQDYGDNTRFVYVRKASSGTAGLRLVLPIEPNITHNFSTQTADWYAPSTASAPEVVDVRVNGNSLDGNYTSEIVSGTNWEKLSQSTYQIPYNITGARTATSPYLTIDDLVLKITKGINAFRYTIPGREVPAHFPLFMGTILDASDVTSDFTITNFWANYYYSSSPEEIHKICNISVVDSTYPFYDGANTFKIYAPNKSLSLPVILWLMEGSYKYSAGYICICTKGTASIKYFGLELLECVLDNATIKMSSTTWATGMKIYLSKNRICEDLTGLDVNITIE